MRFRAKRALQWCYIVFCLFGIAHLALTCGEFLACPPLPESVCRDPGDDKFLACAVAAKVKRIVSGDKDLLSVSGYRGIEVIKPRDFVRGYLSAQHR
jgi:predicted nucleic acid-binding protein